MTHNSDAVKQADISVDAGLTGWRHGAVWTYLVMLAASAAPKSSPASYSVAAFCIISLASSSSMWICASGCEMPWCEPIGTFQT